jgi:hypothetical protein
MKHAETKGHRKQHFVPESYLKAWCDPATPTGQTPYVWMFNKDGSNPRRKAPENIFHESDLYTIHRADGQRDLRLEHGLAGLESEFVRIRDRKLARKEKIDRPEHVVLCAFIAAAHARTPSQRDHLRGQFANLLEKMDQMRAWAKTATPEQRRAMASPASLDSRRPRATYDDVKRIVDKPMETMLASMVQTETPLLRLLDMAIFTTREGTPGFITSDYPCVWFDPEAYKRPPFFQQPALIYRSIEISMPVSPRQMIVLNRLGISGYFDAWEALVDEHNRRTRFHCAEYFVNSSNSSKTFWFDPGEEPEDSWRKQHPK